MTITGSHLWHAVNTVGVMFLGIKHFEDQIKESGLWKWLMSFKNKEGGMLNFKDLLSDAEQIPRIAPKLEKLFADIKTVVSDIEDIEAIFSALKPKDGTIQKTE